MKAIVHPAGRLSGAVRAPSSKNYTTRCILAACLADGESWVRFPAHADDHQALIRCCRQLGAQIESTGPEAIRIIGFGRNPLPQTAPLNTGNAGAVLRFLLAVGALLPEVTFITNYPESLGKRPNQDLLDALAQLGVECESNGGRLPITLRGGIRRTGRISVSGAVSSQFLSGLLFLAPLLPASVEIEVVNGLKSKPAVRQTLDVLKRAGIELRCSSDLLHFHVPAPQAYRPGEFVVNGDYPGAAAILSAAAVVPGSDVVVEGLFPDEQGERAILDVLRMMGACVEERPGGQVSLKAPERLRAVEFDGDRATDAVLAMVGAACLAQGRSRFYNVENLRFKECDRISEPLAELRRLGVVGEERRSEIIVTGRPEGYEGGVTLSGRGDHRVIMLLTIVALRCRRPVIVEGAGHISKSYPEFFDHLRALGAKIELETD
ncbi:MAG: 3-phosphoshikimate 1-carboxyvinyltransferase [Candidatus Sumerlaeia bacterium]